MIGRGSLERAVRLLGAAAMVPLGCAPAFAQTAPPAAQPQPPPSSQAPSQRQQPDAAELDPSAPLAPMPDLGVDWPDLNAKDSNLPASAVPGPTTEIASQLRYTWAI